MKTSKMENRFLTMLAAGLLSLAINTSAIPITGSVDINGVATLNSTSLATATAATAFPSAEVILTPTGAFAGTVGSAVTFTPFGWMPATTPVNPLWTFVSGGRTYSFELASVAVENQGAAFLNLTGQGTLSITGGGSPYDPTPGNWTFTITTSGDNGTFDFGFVSSNCSVPGVPDGGLTVALLSSALVGVAGLRRKLSQ